MKKYSILLVIIIIASNCFAQNGKLIRHDTTILSAEDGKSFSKSILRSIATGKLKAVDPETGKVIPANKIYTWRMPADTVASFDAAGNTKYKVVQQRHSLNDMNQVRIFHDWSIDTSTGKLISVIKRIDLLEEIHSSSGMSIGYRTLCRIDY